MCTVNTSKLPCLKLPVNAKETGTKPEENPKTNHKNSQMPKSFTLNDLQVCLPRTYGRKTALA